MKVGFFVPAKGVMVEVEKVNFSKQECVLAAMQMRKIFASGKHRFPSDLWCAWKGKDFSVFPLSKGMPKQEDLDAAQAAAFWNQ